MKVANTEAPVAHEVDLDEILPEYDFTAAAPNRFAEEYSRGGVVVTLDPDVAEVFGDAVKANEALRTLAGLIRAHGARWVKRVD